jgi:hypothetical protein
MVRRAGGEMYDRFLKANRVEAGIASYGGVVRLILGTRLAGDRTTEPRSSPDAGEPAQGVGPGKTGPPRPR